MLHYYLTNKNILTESKCKKSSNIIIVLIAKEKCNLKHLDKIKYEFNQLKKAALFHGCACIPPLVSFNDGL